MIEHIIEQNKAPSRHRLNEDKCRWLHEKVFVGYGREWHDQIWPAFLHLVSKLLYWSGQDQLPTDDPKRPIAICKYCGDRWAEIGCEQHSIATCPFIQWCRMESFWLYGPGSPTNILCNQAYWARSLHDFAKNPYAQIHGVDIQIRLAYLATVMKQYNQWENGKFPWDLYADLQIFEHNSKPFMTWYKKHAEKHRLGVWLLGPENDASTVFLAPKPKSVSPCVSSPGPSRPRDRRR